MSDNLKFAEKFNDIEMFRYCEQCGRCSSACPITGVNGFNIRRLIRHVELDLIDEIAASPMPWFCATCGRCEDACPNGIKILDITRTLRSVGPEELAPDKPLCVSACPAAIDIPGYLRFIAQGKMEEACKLIIEKAPFPGILGRVCTHPCETACKRGEVNQSISICAAKRYAADKAGDLSEWMSETAPESGHKVAVIGAGPAGLSAAFYLRKKGHQVTIFEARPKAGGMMRYGIPYYRLPEEVLDKEIDLILSTGIELKPNQKLGVDYEIEQLKNDGFQAVFIAVGAQLSRRIELEGSDLADVHWGVEFLASMAEGQDVPVKDRVVVIGGGNVAVDVALTALRLGALKVTLACLESEAEMPANPWEIEQARQEGVEMLYSWGPDKIVANDGKVSGLELVRCSSVFDDRGNFCPYFDDAKTAIEADQVIIAIGQASETAFCQDFCFLDDQLSLPVEKGLIEINKETQETEMKGVFAGGDAANGPATVIEAIAAGRRAAISIDKHLGGNGKIEFGSRNAEVGKEASRNAEVGKEASRNAEVGKEVSGNDLNSEVGMRKSERKEKDENSKVGIDECGNGYDGKRESGFAELKKVEVPTLPVSERNNGFAEVELCFGDEQAKAETYRCLQCDLEICLAKENQAAKPI
ncbi:NAD-dependent dihydropyrimidine dehydrogenase subunit PreT (EC [Olavius sp. associated proteobacterium Delta 1]|nr:NAD-dependent dihydropyrimidine dehydrogenase subunit PreT (EC [Olavius sp. associated proteobacterium Delta 1]